MSNTYCTYCSGTGDRRSCVASGQRCTTSWAGSTVTMELCSALSFEDGSVDGYCSRTLVSGSTRFMHKHTHTSVPTDSAYTCPAGEWRCSAVRGSRHVWGCARSPCTHRLQ